MPHPELLPPPPPLVLDRKEPLACLAITHCHLCEPQYWPLPRTPHSYTEGLCPQPNPQLMAPGYSLLTPPKSWLSLRTGYGGKTLPQIVIPRPRYPVEVKIFALGLSQPNPSHRRGKRRGDQEEGNLFSPKAPWRHRRPQSCLQHSVPFFRPLSLLLPFLPLRNLLSERSS